MTHEESMVLWELEKSSFKEKNFRTSVDLLYNELMNTADTLIQNGTITYEDYTNAMADNFKIASEMIKGNSKKERKQILEKALQDTINHFKNYGEH